MHTMQEVGTSFKGFQIYDIAPHSAEQGAAMALCKEAFLGSGYAHLPYSERRVESTIRRCQMQGYAKLARAGQSPVAILLAEIVPYTFSEERLAIDHLFYVSPMVRSQGIGEVLLNDYMTWGQEKSLAEIMMSSSYLATGENDPGFDRLMGHFGFRKTGEVFKYQLR